MQDKERHILEIIYKYCYQQNYIKNNNCVLCADGIMLLKEDFNESLINHLEREIIKQTGYNYIKLTIKEMDQGYKHEDILKAKKKELDKDSYEYIKIEFEKLYSYISIPHCYTYKYYDINDEEQFTIYKEKELIQKAKIFKIRTYQGKEVKETEFIKYWLEDPNKKTFIDFCNIPHTSPDIRNDFYNCWVPFKMEKVTEYEEDNKALDIILNHINIICGKEEGTFNFFIKWLAQSIQFPHIKNGIMIIFSSTEGTGKSTLIELLRAMLGNTLIKDIIDPRDEIFGSFNNIMLGSYILNFCEVGKRDMSENDKLKALITDTTINIKQKNKPSFIINSYHRFILVSNNEECAKTSKSDRRKIFISCSPDLVGNKEYFINFHNKIIKNVNALKTFYEYLKDIPNMENFHEIPIFRTEYHNELIKNNKSTIIEDFVYNYVEKKKNDFDEGKIKIYPHPLYTAFNEYLTSLNIKFDMDYFKFIMKLNACKRDKFNILYNSFEIEKEGKEHNKIYIFNWTTLQENINF